jgi:hypothetical protein
LSNEDGKKKMKQNTDWKKRVRRQSPLVHKPVHNLGEAGSIPAIGGLGDATDRNE